MDQLEEEAAAIAEAVLQRPKSGRDLAEDAQVISVNYFQSYLSFTVSYCVFTKMHFFECLEINLGCLYTESGGAKYNCTHVSGDMVVVEFLPFSVVASLQQFGCINIS